MAYPSRNVLYSRGGGFPDVGQVGRGSIDDNQFFSVIPGTGKRAGTWAIRARLSGGFLYSRKEPKNLCVYHYGMIEDQARQKNE